MPSPQKSDRLAAARAVRSRRYEDRLAGVLRARGWLVRHPDDPVETLLPPRTWVDVATADGIFDQLLAGGVPWPDAGEITLPTMEARAAAAPRYEELIKRLEACRSTELDHRRTWGNTPTEDGRPTCSTGETCLMECFQRDIPCYRQQPPQAPR
jgi:hypothetical protein